MSRPPSRATGIAPSSPAGIAAATESARAVAGRAAAPSGGCGVLRWVLVRHRSAIADDALHVEHLHRDHHGREQWYGAHQTDEAEDERHQRLRQDREHRRHVDAALHQEWNEKMVLGELDPP